MYKSVKTYEELSKLLAGDKYIQDGTLNKDEWLLVNSLSKSEELKYFYCDHAKAGVLFQKKDGSAVYYCKRCKHNWQGAKMTLAVVGIKAVKVRKKKSEF